jgi:hypothetical protein
MRLAPFPLLGCLLALISINFPFFFFLIKYVVAAFFIQLVDVGVGDFACWLLLELLLLFIPSLRLALVRLVAFLVAYPTNHRFSLYRLVHSLKVA